MSESLGLKEALSDIFDVVLNGDNLSLLYEAIKDVHMAVKTTNGMTERQSIKKVVLQGDILRSILASVQVENICKSVESSGFGYKHENVVDLLKKCQTQIF